MRVCCTWETKLMCCVRRLSRSCARCTAFRPCPLAAAEAAAFGGCSVLAARRHDASSSHCSFCTMLLPVGAQPASPACSSRGSPLSPSETTSTAAWPPVAALCTEISPCAWHCAPAAAASQGRSMRCTPRATGCCCWTPRAVSAASAPLLRQRFVVEAALCQHAHRPTHPLTALCAATPPVGQAASPLRP
jgi:hypothetical protein